MNTRRTDARTFVCDCFAVTGILPLLPSLPRLRHITQCNPAKVSRSFTGKTFRELSSWIRFRLYQIHSRSLSQHAQRFMNYFDP